MRQDHAMYFVTCRTADSVPAELVVQWKQQIAIEQADMPDPQHYRALVRRVEKYLDAPQGECPFAIPECSQIIVDGLLHYDRKRYLLDAYTVMPNHIHMLAMPLPGEDLTRIMADWKKYTARKINELRHQRGPLWATEPFDHIVRNAEALQRFRAYIATNPTKIPHRPTRSGSGSFTAVTGL